MGAKEARTSRGKRTEKSKRLKALKGLYNIHYQRVSLCEISLGSASARGGHGLLAPSISLLSTLSLGLTPSRHLPLVDLRSRSFAASGIPRLWGCRAVT